MERVIFVGDIHGCFDEAVRLFDKLQLSPADWVICLGDYVDRGPENAKCCDFVRHREQVQGRPAGILGNHEEKHLEYEDCLIRGGKLPENMPPRHVATRAQLLPEHYSWFRSLPLFIRVPELNCVAVHAGVFPGRTIETQQARHLLHIQMIRPYDFDERGNLRVNNKSVWPSRLPFGDDVGWRFWTHFWDGPETIVFGHSVLDKPLVTDKVVGIDGGACFGRQLHAYVLPERQVITVDSSTDYGRGRRGTQAGDVKSFLIHGDVSTYS